MTKEERLLKGLEKFDSEQSRKLVLGCMLHLATLLLSIGLGYYLGWGITFITWGLWWVVWTIVKFSIHKMEKEKEDAEPKS
jgi:hypothetical protein